MKKGLILAVAVALLGGCMQQTEHLTINKDGSGTLAVDMMVPEATRTMIDAMLGGMMDGMMKALSGMAKEPGSKPAQVKMPSLSEQMFANKEQILKKAKEAGVTVEFLDFKKEIKNKDLIASYTLRFDDVNKLIAGGLVSMKIALSKSAQGDVILTLKRDEKRARENKAKSQDFKDRQARPQGETGACPLGAGMAQIEEAMDKFRMQFIVTMPNDIKEMSSGVFTRKDAATSSFEVSGNFLQDPTVFNKLYFIDLEEPRVVCSGQGLTFEPNAVSPEKKDDENMVGAGPASPSTPSPPAVAKTSAGGVPALLSFTRGDLVKVQMKNGAVHQGRVTDQGDGTIQLDCEGVPVTFFAEEIVKAAKV